MLSDCEYVQEEWIAVGEEDGRPYATTVCVRRPWDSARFSGTVVVESVHVHGIAPIWIFSGAYILRSGHAWAAVTSQKTALDIHVKPSNPERYASLDIEDPGSADLDLTLRLHDPEANRVFWAELRRRNRGSSAILAQVGAALRGPDGPFAGRDNVRLILAGHSQTGGVATHYIHEAHDTLRLADGSPVYDGYFPSGMPLDAFHDVDTPIVQVMCDGDVPRPDSSFVPGYEGRRYRRDDSDAPGDRYRLYELAGAPHMGTRYAPYNDVSLWNAVQEDNAHAALGPRMNSLPHNELVSLGLHHLIAWVANGAVPPRAERLELDPDGYIAKDEHGNSRGGVRCAQLDVPHSTYRPNPLRPDGTPDGYITVGNDEPFDEETLRKLYGDTATFVERFNRRLDELIAEGWLLAEDADEMRREASRIDIPSY
ncbi:alpha/beta hydrolase domain-containing protein [Frankia sp. EAN1pec]|uniref:alpha/beta hydrolase domain-containing protein n=1 Tax=Parafrankia sp. (strain EAN1pec) TaxID=298653 RepID=UPI00031C529A